MHSKEKRLLELIKWSPAGKQWFDLLPNSPKLERKHEFDADTHKTLILGEDFDEEEDRKDERSYGKDSDNNRYLSW